MWRCADTFVGFAIPGPRISPKAGAGVKLRVRVGAPSGRIFLPHGSGVLQDVFVGERLRHISCKSIRACISARGGHEHLVVVRRALSNVLPNSSERNICMVHGGRRIVGKWGHGCRCLL